MTSTVGIPPSYFCIYKVHSPTPWIFALSGLSSMSIPVRLIGSVHFVHILSWWFTFDCFVSDFYGGISEVFWRTWWGFLRDLVWRFCSDIPESFCSFFRLIITLVSDIFVSLVGLFSSLGYLLKFDLSFWRGLLAI